MAEDNGAGNDDEEVGESMAERADKTAGENMVQALYAFGYDDHLGTVERGQVFPLGGHINDQKMISLRYMIRVSEGVVLRECGDCGKLFVDDGTRQAHGDVHHRFECECGWQPETGVKDKAASLKRHRAKCSVVRSERSAAREQHHRVVHEIKKAAAVGA